MAEHGEVATGTPDGRRSRGGFGPVVLGGVAAAALAAVAGSKPWVSGRSGAFDTSVESNQAMTSTLATNGASEAPLALALALVVLACWGVLLVSRGRFRRVVAVLALVAAVGLVATTVEAYLNLPDKLADALTRMSGASASTELTGWYVAGVVGALLSVVATGLAVARVRTWPEMGSRYDAPATGRADGAAATAAGPSDNIDIWKALDEGRDPTA